MGDRALVVFKSEQQSNISPVVYLHWGGSYVEGYLRKTRELMTGREGDVEYTAARFCGIAHEDTEGNLSLGIWNSPFHFEFDQKVRQETNRKRRAKAYWAALDALKSDDYSHGDAGVFIVDVVTWVVECFNGYGFKSGMTLQL